VSNSDIEEEEEAEKEEKIQAELEAKSAILKNTVTHEVESL
jgi:hypothetical protein